jgi:uncharacterized damage-inducible protein DinB
MTYYGAKELAFSFRQVRGNTLQIANEIPEEKYGFQVTPECRTVAQTLVHVALGHGFQSHIHKNRISDLAGVNFPELMQKLRAEEAAPRTKDEIVALLQSEGNSFASYLEGLSEAFLAEAVAMPRGMEPVSKTRFEMLLSTKEHEMHHRGQLMVVQRLLGQVPHLTRQRQERMAQAASAAAR